MRFPYPFYSMGRLYSMRFLFFFFLSFWLRRMSGMSEWHLHTRHGKRIWVLDVS